MASKVVQRLARVAVLLTGVAMVAASGASARPVPGARQPAPARAFNLFAGSVNVLMNVNRVQCNIDNLGQTCVDPNDSPVLGGGFWPKGSPDQYIFNGGLQIAGIMGGTKSATFPWPGDTVGAYFFDARGTQRHGEGRTNTYNSLSADDIAAWPTAAYINDTTLFNSALIGRKTVSQQDTWVRYWDGNTGLTSGRQHPMGLLVEERGLAWNFPSGNQDIVYFLYRFINITSTTRSDYDSLTTFGYSSADVDDIFSIAQEYVNRVNSVYNIQMPAGGVPFTNMFAAFGQDADVAAAGSNYSIGNLPFSIGYAYQSDFVPPAGWLFPPDIFGAPFAAQVGFEGVKYLKSPINPATGTEFGLTMFTNTTNGGAFPDRVGVQALWRLYSGNLTAVDGSCSVPLSQVQARHFCQAVQSASDTRFYEASGPFTLAPGRASVIVVAYVHAAPVATIPACGGTGSCPGGAWSLSATLVSTSNNITPGLPVDGARLTSGLDTLRNVDRATGWVATLPDANGNFAVDQNEVRVVPRSLLGKSLVAQAVFNARFLLPFAPEGPEFYLVPGDNQVTVAWGKTVTETIGDPYFAVASAPIVGGQANPLYDPNFRKFDVEGYRIWRGRTQAEMTVVASFDYANTTINDFTASFITSSSTNTCAPELLVTSGCGSAFVDSATAVPIPLSGNIIQVPPGGRVKLADGTIFIVTADTAIVGGNSGLPGLTDNGVPFAYVDNTVRNGFRYFYAVTAFDVNSFASGPSSLESPLVTKTVTPRAPSSNNVPAAVVVGLFAGDGTQLDPNTPFPTIDKDNGTFNGMIPPANGGDFNFLASVAEALPPGEYVARIDSVAAGFIGGIGEGPKLYVTFSAPGVTQPVVLDMGGGSSTLPGFNSGAAIETPFEVRTPLVPYDTTRARLVGIPQAFATAGRMPVLFSGEFISINQMSVGTALSQGRYGVGSQASRYLAHSRWFDEGGSEPPDPTISYGPSKDHNSGKLTGVDSIWAPSLYRNPNGAGGVTRMNVNFRGYDYSLTSWYPADFVVTWGAGGTVTVRDSTHRVNLPFNKTGATGYGFFSLANATAAGMNAGTIGDGAGTPTLTRISYQMLYTVDPVCRPTWWADVCANLSNTATLSPLDFNVDGVTDGNGFVLIINQEPFFMKMGALPAAGTKWHLRAVGGLGMSATCTPALPSGNTEMTALITDCSNYSFSPVNRHRPPLAPGLSYKIVVGQAFEVTAASGDLSRIHTVPDPYYVTNSLEITANTKVLRFVNLPNQAIIRIYSTSGILVNVLTHNDQGGGGEAVWNLRNRNNQFVASGVYFYHVETADGHEKIGRFTVINFAQ